MLFGLWIEVLELLEKKWKIVKIIFTGVSVVICNGMAKEAIKTILSGRKIGTFFTDSANVGTVPTEIIAENGKAQPQPKTFIN